MAAALWLCGASAVFAETAEEDDEEVPATEATVEKQTLLVEPSPAAPAADSKAADRFLFFTGLDLWRDGGFAHGGFLWAHQGLSQDGFVFKLLLNGGAYRYRSGTTEIVGRQLMAAALPGWRFRGEGFEFTLFGGVDLQEHTFTPDDPNRLRGTHVGVRGGFDVWYEPLRNVMLTGSASLSTVGSSYWTRAATGYRVFDAVWLGPEFIASGDNAYRQLRFGAHVTSLRITHYEVSLGGGWVTASDGHNGVYGRLGVLVRWDGVMMHGINSN